MASDDQLAVLPAERAGGGSDAVPDGVAAIGEQVRVKHYTARRHRPDGLDFVVRSGEVLVVTGPSGCGKSSLALTLNGLIPQHVEADLAGTVTVLGVDVATALPGELVRRVGMVFQDPDAQLVTTNVLDEVCFGLENLEVAAEEVESRALAALATVGLAEHRTETPGRLSGGQRQRLALAAAIAMRPQLLVLDEPTSHIDPRGAAEFLALLPALTADGTTVVIVDHDLDRVIGYADRLLVLDRAGRALAVGPPAEVFAAAAERIAAAGVRLPIAVSVAQALLRAGAGGVRAPLDPDQARLAFADADTSGCPHPAVPSPAAPQVEVLLRAEGLRVARGRRVIIPELSLTLRRGEFVALLGPNGAGKTTAGLALAGLIRSRGELRLDGADPRRLSMRQLSDRVGYVFQNPEHQFITNTVVDEIAHGLRRRRVPEDEATARVDELLDRLDLGALRDRHPFLLSGGEKRRLSVATVLATRPGLLLLDEPSYGLDEGATAALMSILAELPAAGTTVLMIVHDLTLAADHADRVLVLRDGALVVDGPPATVLTDDDRLVECGLTPLPVRECLRGLRARDPRFAGVHRLEQIAGGDR